MFIHAMARASATAREQGSKGGAAELGGETDAPHCQAIMERTKEKRCPVYDCSRY